MFQSEAIRFAIQHLLGQNRLAVYTERSAASISAGW